MLFSSKVTAYEMRQLPDCYNFFVAKAKCKFSCGEYEFVIKHDPRSLSGDKVSVNVSKQILNDNNVHGSEVKRRHLKGTRRVKLAETKHNNF